MQITAGKMGAKKHVCRYFKGLWTSMTLPELSGAFGDLGTFLPLTVRHRRSIVCAQ